MWVITEAVFISDQWQSCLKKLSMRKNKSNCTF